MNFTGDLKETVSYHLTYQMPLREQIGTVRRDKEFQSLRSCPLSMSCLSEDRKFVQSVTREATAE